MSWDSLLKSKFHAVLEAQQSNAAEVISKSTGKHIDYSPTEGDSKAGYATGEFLNNWRIGETIFAEYTREPEPSRDKKKALLSEELQRILDNMKKDGSIYLYNNSPYALRIEYLGWGKTSAYAPVARAAAEFGE